MKTKKILMLLAVAGLLGACASDQEARVTGKPVPIRLSATVEGSQTRTATTSTTGDTELLDGQTVDAYIMVKGGDWLAQPKACTVNGANGDLTYSGDVFYPMDGTPVSIYAVHPSIASAATFTVQSDQTDDANYAASDLSYSKTADYNRIDNMQTLTFKHLLSKIIVKVQTDLGTVSSVKLRAKKSTTLTYPADNDDGCALGTASGAGMIEMNAGSAGNDGGAIIIPPQTTAADGDVRIIVEISGQGTFVYNFPAGTTFASNIEYTYTVKIGASITVTSSISAWGSDTTGTPVNPDVTNNKIVQIGRPKLPIEYVAETNMMSATELAPDNHVSNIAYFYWGSTTSVMSSTLLGFKQGITISGQKYHLPSMKEWVGVVGNNTWGQSPYIGYGNGRFMDNVEDVAWGVTNNNGTYGYSVDRSFYNDYDYSNTTSRIGYGLRFRERVNSNTINGVYTCAYRYEYINYADEVGNATTYIKIKYIGSNQTITIDDINNETWWNSITPDFERTFPATGHKGKTAQNWPKGTFSTASGGTLQNERGYYWSCDKQDGTNAYSMKPHEAGTYGWAIDVPTFSFTVRLFKDAGTP